MAASGEGKFPNYGGWLNRKRRSVYRSLLPMMPPLMWGNKNTVSSTTWNNWFFGSQETPSVGQWIEEA